MWVKFKQRWQDGLYKYQIGMVVELPKTLAESYCMSGKAQSCKAPKRIMEKIKKEKGENYPSARRKIKRMSTNAIRQQSFNEIADSVFEED